jgi:hypothetical protein
MQVVDDPALDRAQGVSPGQNLAFHQIAIHLRVLLEDFGMCLDMFGNFVAGMPQDFEARLLRCRSGR